MTIKSPNEKVHVVIVSEINNQTSRNPRLNDKNNNNNNVITTPWPSSVLLFLFSIWQQQQPCQHPLLSVSSTEGAFSRGVLVLGTLDSMNVADAFVLKMSSGKQMASNDTLKKQETENILFYYFFVISQKSIPPATVKICRVVAVLKSAGNSFHNCGARTAANRDSVERQLGDPLAVRRRTPFGSHIEHSGHSGVYGLIMSLGEDEHEPYEAR